MAQTIPEIREMKATDWLSVAEIYRQGIETGDATFERQLPTWEDWDHSHFTNCRLVAVFGEMIAGWAALSPVSSRCIYAGVAEVSIYVAKSHRGKKLGFKLLEKLIIESEKEGFWTLQAGIFPENLASLRIHQSLGFREVGYREKIGKMNGRWRDTIVLERRSKTTGIE